MSQKQSMATPQQIQNLFSEAIEPGEKLKIKSGPAGTVVFNTSNIGKPQDRLTSEVFNQLESTIHQDTGNRVEVPLTENHNPKRPEIEVTAISEDGKERTLFRQEKGLGISTNTLFEITKELQTEQTTDQVDTEPQIANEQPVNDEPITIESQSVEYSEPEIVDGQPVTTETLPVDSQSIDNTEPQIIDAQPATVEPAPNTIETLKSRVDSLPPSQTKALWQKISADFSTLNTQLQAISQTGKDLKDSVIEVPKSLQQDTKVLIKQGKQKIQAIRDTVTSSIKQTSFDDIASMAIKGTSLAVETGSKGLGVASQYLSDRADNVKSYGMAKAAITIYQKGNSRTGESIFKTDEGYTVEAVTEGYTIRDSKDRLIMSFATDSQNKPISVTKSPAIQPADYKVINQASKQPVIHGSAAGEKSYQERLQSIADSIKSVLPEGNEINGNNHFHIKRPTFQRLSISTHGFPQRQLNMDDGGNITHSTLTIEDMTRLDGGLEKAQAQSLEQMPKESEKVPVGIEMG